MADNAAAFAALDAQIQRLRSLRKPVAELAPKVADTLRTELELQIAAGTAPDGTPWQLTQAGEKPLRRAAAALEVKASGDVVIARLTGPTALHHLGDARGGIKRQVLPDAHMPERLTAAIEAVVLDELSSAVTGE